MKQENPYTANASLSGAVESEAPTPQKTNDPRRTYEFTFLPGDRVSYSDVQFHLPDASLKCIKIYSFGIYCELMHDGEEYTVKYERLQRPKDIVSTEIAQAVEEASHE
jgi:hypothetical protein